MQDSISENILVFQCRIPEHHQEETGVKPPTLQVVDDCSTN